MNEFRLRATGQVITELAFRASQQVVFPAVIDKATANANGIDPVLAVPAPVLDDPLLMAVRDGVTQDALGNWVYAWQVVSRFTSDADGAAYLSKLLADRRAALHDSVAAKRQSVQEAGCAFRFPDGLTGTIQTRTALDLGNITGQALAALILQSQAVAGPVLSFRDEQNVTHTMTPAQMVQMGMASSAFVSATYAAKWAHDAAIDAWQGAKPYDISTGWPA